MKRIATMAMAGLTVLLATFSCQKQSEQTGEISSRKPPAPPSSSSCTDYVVTLTRTYANGQTTFIWTIVNPNPGNGSNGTLQNLSHWSFIPGCPENNGLEQNWSDIYSASYSYNGVNYTDIVPVPEFAPDPSQNCTNANVFKFNQGTSSSAPTYYKLVLWGNYGTDLMTAYFKSGANTGCCSKNVQGIGCKESSCSYSQGYFFASPHDWPTPTVEVGGYTYTEIEGRAIWNCSNAGGIRDSKKGFTQVAALKLSGLYPPTTGDVSIDADIATIEAWLATLGKLVACSNLPTGNADVKAAAGRIGQWINANHCGQ
jgi:hypothetical protein